MPCLEALLADQGVEHPDDLGTLLVDRAGVEIVDLDVAVGADRVRQRPGILGELRVADERDVADPLDRRRVHVGR